MRGAAAAQHGVTFLSTCCRRVEAGEVGVEDFAFGLLLVGGGETWDRGLVAIVLLEGQRVATGIRRWLGWRDGLGPLKRPLHWGL